MMSDYQVVVKVPGELARWMDNFRARQPENDDYGGFIRPSRSEVVETALWHLKALDDAGRRRGPASSPPRWLDELLESLNSSPQPS